MLLRHIHLEIPGKFSGKFLIISHLSPYILDRLILIFCILKMMLWRHRNVVSLYDRFFYSLLFLKVRQNLISSGKYYLSLKIIVTVAHKTQNIWQSSFNLALVATARTTQQQWCCFTKATQLARITWKFKYHRLQFRLQLFAVKAACIWRVQDI